MRSPSPRLALGLSLLNGLLLLGLIAAQARSASAKPPSSDVLRGRSLEIVDENGTVRASIRTHGPETVNGKLYPGAVVLVMGGGDPNGAPAVKLAASGNGAGLGLSNGMGLSDGRSVGIQFHATDGNPRILLIDAGGHEREVKP
jgi:hypothetical protein